MNASIAFPNHELEIIVYLLLESNDLLLRSIHKHEATNDRLQTDHFLSLPCAYDLLFGNEIGQSPAARKQFLSLFFIFIGPHDIPFHFRFTLFLCHVLVLDVVKGYNRSSS